MKNEEMPYLIAAQGKRPKTMPIVIEIQSITAPSNTRLREKYGFEEIMKNAELSARCTVAPIAEVGYDAAIHVSDLLIPVEAMGIRAKHSREGPRVENPVRTMADVERLIIPEPEQGMKVWLDSLRIAKRELTGKVPLIGWVGGPLSTSSFLIEGGLPTGLSPYHHMKTMMYAEPKTLHALLSKLTEMYARFVPYQVAAGADVMMILDLRTPASMSPEDYQEFSFPYLKRLVNAVKATSVPLLFSSDGTSFLSSPVHELDIDIIGLDWTIDLAKAIQRLGGRQAVQGNLEPYCLFAPDEVIEKRVREIVEAGKAAPAHVFSLGGWIIRNTPFEKVKFLVDLVHSL